MTTQRDEVPLTQTAYDELKKELEFLRTDRRREVAENIQQTRDTELDLDEDFTAAFEAAKEEQYFVEGRITQIEQILGNATIIDEAAARASDTITLGSVVVLEYEQAGERVYQIVGTVETDPAAGKISEESPIAAALMGKRVGEMVEVEAPAGVQHFRIKELR